jgi:hypothetical protein
LPPPPAPLLLLLLLLLLLPPLPLPLPPTSRCSALFTAAALALPGPYTAMSTQASFSSSCEWKDQVVRR